MPTNRDLAELLTRTADEEPREHRREALRRAARSAMFRWAEEAAAVAARGDSLTTLPSVGPWLARILLRWLEDEDLAVPEPPTLRRGFLTLAEVRATLAEEPGWRQRVRADLQMHTTYSDGRASLRQMVAAAAGHGYEHVAVTDHSQGLRIARGMDEERLAAQADEMAALNADLEREGLGIRVLHGIEMNLSPEGEGDMPEDALRRLGLVLGAFHSHLRLEEDQTERYLRALRNPTVHVLAHPRGRRFGVRAGLRADWRRVAEEAAALDKALEIDAYPDRQDLDVELLGVVREAGGPVSIGTDAHSVSELAFMEFGVAAAVRAGIPPERILNRRSREDLLAWAAAPRPGA